MHLWLMHSCVAFKTLTPVLLTRVKLPPLWHIVPVQFP